VAPSSGPLSGRWRSPDGADRLRSCPSVEARLYSRDMGIRLVYGLDTDDLSYLDIFYPSKRLAQAAAAIGLDYAASIFTRNGRLTDATAFCRGHVALLRGELPATLYESLEAAGIFVVNSAAATALAKDKVASAAFFKAIGAYHPHTVVVDWTNSALPLAPPFVLKPRFGKMGRGIKLVETSADWATCLLEKAPVDFLAQDYVEASRGRDIRFFFANFDRARGQTNVDGPGPVAVLRRGPALVSNAHSGGVMDFFDAPESLLSEARRIFAASGLAYGTVDFLFADTAGSAFTVCEINSCPGFEEFERVTGLDAAGAILSSTIAATSNRTADTARQETT